MSKQIDFTNCTRIIGRIIRNGLLKKLNIF